MPLRSSMGGSSNSEHAGAAGAQVGHGAAGGVVVVAELLVAERGAAAAVAVGEEVAAAGAGGWAAGLVRSWCIPLLGKWAKVFERFGLGPDFGFWSGRFGKANTGVSPLGLRPSVEMTWGFVLFVRLNAKARREAGLGLIVAGWGKLFCNFMLLILRVVRGFGA